MARSSVLRADCEADVRRAGVVEGEAEGEGALDADGELDVGRNHARPASSGDAEFECDEGGVGDEVWRAGRATRHLWHADSTPRANGSSPSGEGGPTAGGGGVSSCSLPALLLRERRSGKGEE